MSDYLINLGQNKTLKSLFGAVGIATPQQLKRGEGPWKEKSLAGRNILTGYCAKGTLEKSLTDIYKRLGTGTEPAQSPEDIRYNGLVFDATGIQSVMELSELYEFFHDSIRKLARCGKILIINQQPKDGSLEAIAAFQAMEGFMRSVAKETGRKGATANMIQISSEMYDIEKKLLPVLHFFLSDYAAFIDGQVIRLSSDLQILAEVPLAQPLAGKVALVTGAARGIGEATARTLAREGAQVVILDISGLEQQAKKVAESINGKLLLADISAEGSPVRICDYLMKEFSGVDIVVHNAGITRDKTLGKMSRDRWDAVLNINLQSILNVTDELKKGTLKQDGRIICLSSISGFAGNFGQTNYASTKAGIIGYVKALAKELAPKNISANAIAPGFIESDMTAKMPFMTREFARRLSNLSQGGIPQDVAEAITFLASPGAASITGQTLRVCGGSLIGA